ncbi:serine/threonine protein kinase [Brevibacillus choshinensis]|uniref:Serine/threonine protein kinase n=1 Tax=Brevibacillus choshinensis TaxID=54911 RepID=A0ABX7FHV4_BRECH|nr:serine/threonine-protein kinase [Brevibacillus choshinensis]QRG65363.1 serine/threonine protein kinase [Brevibacillus choshinensis]
MWNKIVTWWNDNVRDRPYAPGRQIRHYRIRKVLGMGSYGIAYLAIDLRNDAQVVLKQVKPSLRHSPKGEAMQAYEQKVLSALSHPQIPRWLDSFTYRRDSFLVMTFIEGPTLEEALFDHRITIDEREAARLMKKIAEIVAHLHEHHLIHRDVRIPNVIWHQDEPYLIDFGLARFIGDSPTYAADSLTAYHSEKQVKREVAPSSDLFALGHFFLFLLYSGYTPNEEDPERSWEQELSLTPAVRSMIRRLLQADAPYPAVEDFLDDLEQYLCETSQAPTQAGM